MNEKKFFYRIIISIIVLLLLNIFINYTLNPYGVFKKYQNYSISTPINERYLKTSYILDNPLKYDSFIFGSSRVGTLEGENLQIGKFYNMTYSTALPRDILEIIKIFVEAEISIKNIILGIDDFDFYTEPDGLEERLYRISYKKLKENKYNFLKYYLLKNSINKINYVYLFSKEKTHFDILNTGKWEKNYADKVIENTVEFHRKGLANKKINSFHGKNRIEKTIFEIKQIIDVCEKNNINLIIVYLPLYKHTYNANKQIIDKSRIELQKITSYWDMIELKKFTDDEYYWYEESHYRPILGRRILKRIFGKNFNINIEDNLEVLGLYREKNKNF